jgi:predicted SnoaL-like aldol condensation-catalyzing enzyme
MKKFLFILSAGSVFLFTSCADKKKEGGSGASDKAAKNLASNHIVMDAFGTGDISKIDSAVAGDFVMHAEPANQNRDSLKAQIIKGHQSDPTMKMETVKELADDDYVFSWVKMSGNSDGSMGMPKGPYTMNTVEVSKFKDGKASDHWSFCDMHEMMQMMGGAQPPADHSDKATKDTAK